MILLDPDPADPLSSTTPHIASVTALQAAPLAPGVFRRLAESIFARRPILHHVVQTYGGASLYEYARQHLVNPVSSPFGARSEEFLTAAAGEIGRLFGSEIASRATAQLRRFFSASTADHHGPLTHSFFVNPNLLSAAASEEDPVCRKEFIITFPIANVSFNNSSFPRGLLYHAMHSDELDMGRLAFIPAKYRQSSLYGAVPYTREDAQRVHLDIDRQGREFSMPSALTEKMHGVVREVYETDIALNQRDYADQMTMTNYALWKRFFPEGSRAPDLLHLPLENIVNRLLLDYHVDGDTILSRVLFDAEIQRLVSALFNGVQGAFDLSQKTGTYLFWGLSEKGNFVSLFPDGRRCLVDATGTLKIEMSPQAIREAITAKLIVPSMLLDFIVAAFYYGLRCVGGYSQVNYLPQIQEQWMKFLSFVGADASEIDAVSRVETKGYVGDLAVAYIRDTNGKMCLASGLDLILYQQPDMWTNLRRIVRNVTLGEAFYALCADFYPITYGADERDPELMGVNAAKLLAYLDAEERCGACVRM